MVHKLITSILFVLSLNNSSILAQKLSWSHGLGTTEFDFDPKLAVDLDGNLFTAGYFQGTIDFDPGPGATSMTSGAGGFGKDSYVSKFDTTGKFLWVKRLTSDQLHIAKDIVFDSDGFLYITGYYVGTCDFDPGPNQFNLTTPNFSYDSFVLKLDTNGNFVWAVTIGGTGQEYARTITLDDDGNLVIAGAFTGTGDFDPGPNQTIFTCKDISDVFVLKLTANGDFLWADHITGTFQSDAFGVDADSLGNIYVTGPFDGRRDFNPGPDSSIEVSAGFWDAYLVKLNPLGQFQWVRHLGNDTEVWPYALAVDNKGNVHVTGFFKGTVDFKPGPDTKILSAINSDVFVWKLDKDGQLIWVDQFGGISYEQGRSITLGEKNSIYFTGYYAETIDFDPGADTYYLTCTGNNDENDVYVAKLNADGSLAWAHTAGGLGADAGGDIQLGRYHDIFLSGMFEGKAGFNPGTGSTDSLSSHGMSDYYLARWIECADTYYEFSTFSCGSYYSPSGNYSWNTSGTYPDTINNAAGCDSILTIHLAVSDLGLVVTQLGNTLFGDGGAGNFFWLDCDKNFSIVAQGNEFTPATNGNYALTGSGIICSDTSACFAFVMTATKDLDPSLAISIYPNPAKNSFSINLGQLYNDITISLINPEGRMVYSGHHINQEIIPVEMDLPPGIYFVSVTTSNKTFLKKVVIK